MIGNLKDALLERLNSLGNLGLLHLHQRYAKQPKDVQAFYVTDEQLLGGYLRWSRGENNNGGTMGVTVQRDIDLILFCGLQDQEATELLFDSAMDGLMQDFVINRRAGDWTTVNGWRLVKNEPAMVAGVLVHYAVLQSSWQK